MSSCRALFALCSLLSFAALPGQAAEGSAPRLSRQANSTAGSFYEVGRDGRYIMRYETPSGIIHYETGYLRRAAEGIPYQVKEGYYIYPTSDGRRVRVAYFADHQGYRVISYQIRRHFVEDPANMRPNLAAGPATQTKSAKFN